jgi:excinuclease ABC subunit C
MAVAQIPKNPTKNKIAENPDSKSERRIMGNSFLENSQPENFQNSRLAIIAQNNIYVKLGAMSKEDQKPLKVSGTFSSKKVPDTLRLRETVRTLPDLPGIYQFKDAKGAILYIGKAKSLKKRVAQYFAPTRLEPLKQEMMKLAFSVETIIVKNETEALVLEGTLIHKHRPPYNVRLVDDSSYLYIRISNEAYPKISLERKVATDGAWYRGPYPNSRAVRQTLKEARKFFPWCGYPDPGKSTPALLYQGGKRVATPPLTKGRGGTTENIQRMFEGVPAREGFRRPCFAYHIGLCPGICVGAVSLEEYQNNFVRLKKFLDGDTDAVLDAITERMNQLSQQQQYEKAGALRDRIKAIKQTMIPQDVITPRNENADVFGLAHRGGHGSIALLQLRQGRIIGRQLFPLLLPDKKEEKDIWEEFLAQYLPTAQGGAEIIYLPTKNLSSDNVRADVPVRPNATDSREHGDVLPYNDVHIIFPERGWKKQLIEMAITNAQESLNRSETELQSPQNLIKSITDLQEKLNLPTLPKRIETYDISNIQGKLATASMVVFIDGKSTPSEYRKFKIINDGEPNDVGMMKETLERRFKNRLPLDKGGTRRISKTDDIIHPRPPLIKEGNRWPVPNLIVLDGGKPQLNTIHKLFIDLGINIPLISLAKREEEIFTTNSNFSIILDRTSPAFYLMQRMRDEAHRFTISYHRLLRKKRMTKSILEEIPGVGPDTRKKLLRAFGSLSGIRTATVEDIEKVLGTRKKAEILVEFLKR